MSYQMTQKEIVKRIIDHDAPPRFGWNFLDPDYNDIAYAPRCEYINEAPNPYAEWGKHEELLKLTGFKGEVSRDRFGNIYGRFNGKTKGECIRGVIQTWDDFEKYQMPEINPAFHDKLVSMGFADNPKYIMCGGCSIFSDLRDARLIGNALADTALEPEMVEAFLDRVVTHNIEVIKNLKGGGIDCMMIYDDWGTQDRTFISPSSFAELFKPAYKRLCDALHEVGMKCAIHSCGYIYAFIEDLIEAGVDVFQFDQPDVYPSETLAKEFGSRVTFYSPVDIQKVLPTGDKDFIQNRTLEMINTFKENCGGGLIFKDYPTYSDIGVDMKWAEWAKETIISSSGL